MPDVLAATVRFLHVLFGLAWVGGLLFFGHAFLGGINKLRDEVRVEAMQTGIEKAATFSAVAGPVTLILGLWNQYLVAGTLRFRGGTWNVLLGAAVLVTLAMLGLLFGMVWPSLQALEGKTGGPSEHERRARMGLMSSAGLGVVVLMLMVLAEGTRTGAI
jgi:uncharacterized membrane protein